MATANYPGALFTRGDVPATLPELPTHSEQHNQLNAEVAAIEAKLGTAKTFKGIERYATAAARDLELAPPTVGQVCTVAGDLQVNTTGTAAGWQSVNRRIGGRWSRVGQSIPSGKLTDITFTIELEDTDGFAAPNATAITVPAGLGGVYAVSAVAQGLGPNGVLSLLVGGERVDDAVTPLDYFASASVVMPLVAGATCLVRVYRSDTSGAGMPANASVSLYLYRLYA